tara:strand:+ start:2627 stop:3085 length:459 start_codon:yes stop_codon:yes gene_type:complete
MKTRNKKHNPVEAARKNNIRVLKGFAIAFIANDKSSKEPIKLINLKGDERPVTKTMSDAITVFRYKWSVMLAIFCIEKGNETCKFEIIEFKQPYLQSELVVYLNERHQAFIVKQKKMNVRMVGAGWLASPVGRDFTSEEAGDIFKKLGAWSC